MFFVFPFTVYLFIRSKVNWWLLNSSVDVTSYRACVRAWMKQHCHGNAMVVWQLIAMLDRSSSRLVRGDACSHAMALHALERQDRNGVREEAIEQWWPAGLEASRARPCMHACSTQGHRRSMHVHSEREGGGKEEIDRWTLAGELKKLDAHITCVLSKVVRVCHKYLSISIYPIYIVHLSLSSLSYITYPFCTLFLHFFDETSSQPASQPAQT